jgi:hypothetical protein
MPVMAPTEGRACGADHERLAWVHADFDVSAALDRFLESTAQLQPRGAVDFRLLAAAVDGGRAQ